MTKAKSNSLSAFYAQNAKQPEKVEREISKRFSDDEGNPLKFVFKAISPSVDTKIQSKAMKTEFIKEGPKKGQKEQVFDAMYYQLLLTVESIEYPNLKDAELQNTYGVMDEVSLYDAMLLPSESVAAYAAAQEANGYEHAMKDLVEDAKN